LPRELIVGGQRRERIHRRPRATAEHGESAGAGGEIVSVAVRGANFSSVIYTRKTKK
jgi:hypothetical protein